MRIFHLEGVKKCKMHNLHKAKITVIVLFLLLLLLLLILVAVLRNIYFCMFGVLEITSDCANRRVFGKQGAIVPLSPWPCVQ